MASRELLDALNLSASQDQQTEVNINVSVDPLNPAATTKTAESDEEEQYDEKTARQLERERQSEKVAYMRHKLGMTFEEIGVKLGMHENTARNRYTEWLMSEHQKEQVASEFWNLFYIVKEKDQKEALRQISKVYAEQQKQQAKTEITLTQNSTQNTVTNVCFRWLTDDEWKNKLSSSTVRIPGKENFMTAQQDSAS